MSHAELAETIGLVVPLIYFAMLAIEWRWPAARWRARWCWTRSPPRWWA